VYNKTLHAVKTKKDRLNAYELRNKYVTAKNNPEIQSWELNTPKDIRAGAIRDLEKNFKSALSLLKTGHIRHFKMSYCRKKDTPSIEIPKSALKWDSEKRTISMYPSYMKEPLKISKRQNKKDKTVLDFDCRLMEKDNQWYLVVPIKVKNKKKNPDHENCALDPGVRTFQTIYSQNEVLKVKINAVLLRQLQLKIDKFKSLRAKKIISKQRMVRKEKMMYRDLNHYIDDMHYKTCRTLTNKYKTIILPYFESQEMVRNGSIGKKRTHRDMLQMKHYLFQTRLKQKCRERGNSLVLCTEEFTSQTCGNCGHIKKMGGKAVYDCDSCKIKIDRDVNGARNILLKWMISI
jgi:putative transposase